MIDLIYKYGMDKAAQERGYPDYEAFAKEAFAAGVGRAAMRYGLRGAGAGAVVGGLGNMAFGNSNQGLLERGLKGAAGGALAGGAVGAGLGAGTQSMYRGHLQNASRQLAREGVDEAARGQAVQNLSGGHAYGMQSMLANGRNQVQRLAPSMFGNMAGYGR